MSEKVLASRSSSRESSGVVIGHILVKKPSATKLKRLGSCLNEPVRKFVCEA